MNNNVTKKDRFFYCVELVTYFTKRSAPILVLQICCTHTLGTHRIMLLVQTSAYPWFSSTF